MASVVEPARGTPTRHEWVVDRQLEQARRRIRSLDLSAGLLGLVIGLLLFAGTMILLDKWLTLPALARQLALAVGGVMAAVYVWWAVLRPWRHEINPYYAAKRVERTVPNAKNSLVNWLDLRNGPLPAAIRAAVGQRAAQDIHRADLQQAITGKHVAALASVAGGLFLGLLLLVMLFGREQFLSLVGRTFTPFRSTAIATRTRITVLQPVGGNATIPANQLLTIVVDVEGRVPLPGRADSLKLLYRYQPTDPTWMERELEEGKDSYDWLIRMTPRDIQTGFWYKIVGGDAETPEYHVQVRSSPALLGVEARIEPRPYLQPWMPVVTSDSPLLTAMKGSRVVLTVRTNRTVRDGRLTITGARKDPIGTPVPGQPDSLQFEPFVLERDGEYRIHFTSTDGETNQPIPYPIKALTDLAPRVEITHPVEDDVALPLNGTLVVEGLATDDFGIDKLNLRLKVKDGRELRAIPYRQGRSFKLESGAWPRRLDYREVVALEQLHEKNGQPAVFAAGTDLEAWLEASDNCDYPGPNLGRSQRTVRIRLQAVPSDPQQRQQQQQQQQQNRQQQQQQQKQHEQKQDQQLNKDNQEAKAEAQRQKDEADPQKQKERQEQAQKEAELKKELEQLRRELEQQPPPDKNPGEKPPHGKPEPKPQNDNKGEDKPDQPQPMNGEPGGEPKEPPSGEDKPPPSDKSQPQADNKGEGAKPEAGPNPGEGKPEGKPQPQPQQGEDKPQGEQPMGSGGPEGDAKPQPEAAKSAGDGKTPGQKKPSDSKSPDGDQGDPSKNPDPKSGTNDAQKPNSQGPSDGKPDGQKPPQDAPAESKGSGSAKKPNDGAQGKPDQPKPGDKAPQAGEPKSDGQPQPAEPKGQGETGGVGQQPPAADAKPEKAPPPKAEPKDAPKSASSGQKPDDARGEPKPMPPMQKGEGNGDLKPAQPDDPKSDKPEDRRSDAKGDQPQGAGRAVSDQKPGKNDPPKTDETGPQSDQVKDLAKQMQQGDAASRDKARQQLEDIKKNAPDARDRQAAEKALQGDPGQPKTPSSQGNQPSKQSDGPSKGPSEPMTGDQPAAGGQNAGQQPGQPKEEPRDDKSGGDAKAGRSGTEDGSATKPQAGRKGDTAADKPMPPRDPNTKPIKGMGEDGMPAHEPAEGKSQGRPGQGTTADQPSHPRSGSPPPDEKGTEADPRHKKKSSDLQLEDLRKLLKDPKVREKLKISETQAEEMLQSYKNLLDREAKTGRDNTKGGSRTGPSILNRGGVRQTGTGPADDLNRGGAGKAPPEFRDGYQKFTEELSRSDKK